MIRLPITICAILESAINAMLQLDDASTQSWTVLQGKVVGIKLTDVNMELFLLFGDDNQVTVMGQFDNKVDAWVKGSTVSLTRMGLVDNPNELVLKGDVAIEGDVQAASAVRQFAWAR